MPHTHSSLRAQFLQQARFIAPEVTSETDHHDIAQVDRVREILLMAIRLIDARIGSPYQIERLVDERIEEIQEEMCPFVPDPFVTEPPASEPEQSRLPPYFFSGVVAVIHNARRVSDAAQPAALQATPPRRPLFAIDSASSSPITTLEDPESPSYGRDRVASIRAQLRAGPPLTRSYHWVHIHTRLQKMLDEHIAAHTNQYRGLDYHETIGCLEDAIETAGTRQGNLSPSMFMERVERDLESFKRVEERRRDCLKASQDEEGRPDNEGQQEEGFGELTGFEDADEDWEDEDSDTSADSLRKRVLSHAVPDWHSPLVVRERREVLEDEKVDGLDISVGSQQKRASAMAKTRPVSTQTTDITTALRNWYDPDLTPRRPSTLPQPSTTKSSPPVTPSQHPPHPRAQLRSYTFLPIKHAGSPMQATPPIMRRFYRRTVEHTLEELLNSTASSELRDLVNAYWAHVEAQVPHATDGSSAAGDL